MPRPSTAIIGAGMAGLTAARTLRAIGQQPLVLDKGRGIGGRLATRTTREGFAFDHGAQYVTARSARFRALLDAATQMGHAALWETVDGRDRFVGAPGMNALALHVARSLEVRRGVEVDRVRPRAGGGWTIAIGDDAVGVDTLVLAVPPAQAARLLGDHPLAEPLAAVEMAPCLTLMAVFPPGDAPPFDRSDDAVADLAFICHDGAKPGRAGPGTWVAQAGPDWSRQHLEADKDEIARLMLPMLAEAIGRAPSEALLVRGHRWRYARTLEPLGAPFLADQTGSLYVCGDWCLGARVEAAWESGLAVAEAIVGRGV